MEVRSLTSGTPPGHADEIGIATLYLMTMMMMAVFIRLIFRYVLLRSLQLDDGIICVGLLIAIAQSSCVMAAVNNGFGNEAPLTLDALATVLKNIFVSQLLYVLGLSFSKLSILRLLSKLCVNKSLKRACFYSMILVVIWTVPVFLTVAFQCGGRGLWDSSSDQCINTFTFWAAVSSIDIVTELVICVLPLLAILPVQVTNSKKVTIVMAFSFRIFVIISTIIRLAFLSQSNTLLPSFETTVTTQVVLCVSIVTACVPCLKLFLEAFDSGMLNMSRQARFNNTNSGPRYGHNSFALKSISRGAKDSTNVTVRTRDVAETDEDSEGLGTSAAAFAVSSPGILGKQVNSNMVIQRTDQWSVMSEHIDQVGGYHVDEIGSEPSERPGSGYDT